MFYIIFYHKNFLTFITRNLSFQLSSWLILCQWWFWKYFSVIRFNSLEFNLLNLVCQSNHVTNVIVMATEKDVAQCLRPNNCLLVEWRNMLLVVHVVLPMTVTVPQVIHLSVSQTLCLLPIVSPGCHPLS